MRRVKSNIAVGYIRVSLKKMAENGESLATQKDKIRSYCVLHDLELKHIIEDAGISGKLIDNRKGFRRVMEMVSKREINHIVCYSLSRWGRDVVDTMTTLKSMEKNDVSFHSVIEHIDTATPTGRFFLTVLSALTSLEREQLAERTSEILQFKKRNGVVYSPTPYGLDRCGMKLKTNQSEMKIIQKMKRLRTRGTSYQGIAEWLNNHGHKSKTGKKFYGGTVRYIVNNSLPNVNN